MGNTVPPRTSCEAGGRRSKNGVPAPATPRREVDADAGETTPPRAWRPRAGRVLRAGGGVGGGSGDGAPGGKVVTVRIVMGRKDAEALAARLNARERKARMAELKSELRGGGGGGRMSPAAPCRGRDACWSRRLPPIKES
ncbi:hypothetical protein BS78_03G232900 [Paspalum vaginatum]|nr:hypothetical protein BS78_03G232900 [Paspalum vaginatum]